MPALSAVLQPALRLVQPREGWRVRGTPARVLLGPLGDAPGLRARLPRDVPPEPLTTSPVHYCAYRNEHLEHQTAQTRSELARIAAGDVCPAGESLDDNARSRHQRRTI